MQSATTKGMAVRIKENSHHRELCIYDDRISDSGFTGYFRISHIAICLIVIRDNDSKGFVLVVIVR